MSSELFFRGCFNKRGAFDEREDKRQDKWEDRPEGGREPQEFDGRQGGGRKRQTGKADAEGG